MKPSTRKTCNWPDCLISNHHTCCIGVAADYPWALARSGEELFWWTCSRSSLFFNTARWIVKKHISTASDVYNIYIYIYIYMHPSLHQFLSSTGSCNVTRLVGLKGWLQLRFPSTCRPKIRSQVFDQKPWLGHMNIRTNSCWDFFGQESQALDPHHKYANYQHPGHGPEHHLSVVKKSQEFIYLDLPVLGAKCCQFRVHIPLGIFRVLNGTP